MNLIIRTLAIQKMVPGVSKVGEFPMNTDIVPPKDVTMQIGTFNWDTTGKTSPPHQLVQAMKRRRPAPQGQRRANTFGQRVTVYLIVTALPILS